MPEPPLVVSVSWVPKVPSTDIRTNTAWGAFASVTVVATDERVRILGPEAAPGAEVLADLARYAPRDDRTVVLFPPALSLAAVRENAKTPGAEEEKRVCWAPSASAGWS